MAASGPRINSDNNTGDEKKMMPTAAPAQTMTRGSAASPVWLALRLTIAAVTAHRPPPRPCSMRRCLMPASDGSVTRLST